MLFYTVVIARALATGRTAGCNCFGSESTAPVSRYTWSVICRCCWLRRVRTRAAWPAARVCSSRCSRWMPPAGSGRGGRPSSRQPWMRYAAAILLVRRMSVLRLSCPSRCTTRTARSCTCACPSRWAPSILRMAATRLCADCEDSGARACVRLGDLRWLRQVPEDYAAVAGASAAGGPAGVLLLESLNKSLQ